MQVCKPCCRQPRSFPNDGRSIVAIIDKAALLEVLEPKPSNEATKAKVLEDISHHEEIFAWIKAIAQWMEQRYNSETVSLKQLQQALGMPLIELWLGMLIGGQDQY